VNGIIEVAWPEQFRLDELGRRPHRRDPLPRLAEPVHRRQQLICFGLKGLAVGVAGGV
jgi:hypothetical protein